MITGVTCCDLNNFVKAMADENRQRIMALLQQGEMSVSELVEHFSVTQPTISHHLAILRRAHLVTIQHRGQWVYYKSNPDCVVECCNEILRLFPTNQEEKEP